MESSIRETIDAATAGIGARLAAIRRDRGLRVSELARRAEVSSSLISQIERGSSKPSVGTLFALARVLDVSVDLFFTDGDETTDGNGGGGATPAPPGPAAVASPDRDRIMSALGGALPWGEMGATTSPVVRAGERASLDISGGVRWERLTPRPLDNVEFLELVYEPGAESHPQAYRHPGIELVLVLEGTMTVALGFDENHLNPGDTIAFPSSTPHRYVNLTDKPARAVTVILRDDISRLPIRESSAGDGEPQPAASTESFDAQ